MNRVGIPRSLFYYYYGNFWQDFFDSLNIPYILSPISNQEIVNKGIKIASDEMCLSLKNYLGHIDYLKDKCDYILVPRISNFKNSNQTCTNFWAAYDIVKNKFQNKLLHYNIDLNKGKTLKKGLYKIGKEMGKTKHQIKRAYKYALIKDKKRIKKNHIINLNKLKSDKTKILIVGHPYNLYDEQQAKIDIEGTLSTTEVYAGESTDLNLTTNFIQPTVSGSTVMDTTYFDKKLGVHITIYDANGNQLNNSSLLGLNYEVDGITYYPRMDGSVRIPLADKVANVFSKIKIHTNTANLVSGTYTLKVESFGSPDGIYFGTTPSDQLEIPFQLINSQYGLDVSLDDTQFMIDKDTGFTIDENNALVFHMKYTSSLENPNIRVQLYRRNYDDIYTTEYTSVDLLDYVTNQMEETQEFEYMFEENPTGNMDKFLYLKDQLTSGTYKFVFRLYDNQTFIGDSIEYVIIK